MPPESAYSPTRYFHISCDAILKNWSALKLAVSNEAGGSQTNEIAQWMVDAVVQWFNENENLEGYEVADFLEQIMAQEFNMQIEDGSSDEIGTAICEFYQLCSSSKSPEEIISKVRTLTKCVLSISELLIIYQINGERSKINDGSNVEEQMTGMEVDETTPPDPSMQQNANAYANTSIKEPDVDGWMVVERTKK